MNKKKITFIAIVSVLIATVCAVYLSPVSSKRPKDQYGSEPSDNPILVSALDYVNTHPVYQSKYYDGGWPNDGHGTCVDVVGFALKANGIDLREEVDRDIHTYPELYDVLVPDANIDFRRVKNLTVWLRRNTKNLTTDIHDIDAWQAGDIVTFANHIGIISDRRNANGVPYVIHHTSRFQRRYEQDILEKRTDITGHFRIRKGDS